MHTKNSRNANKSEKANIIDIHKWPYTSKCYHDKRDPILYISCIKKYGLSCTTCLTKLYLKTQLLLLRNDLHCVAWGVKLYSLTHCVFLDSAMSPVATNSTFRDSCDHLSFLRKTRRKPCHNIEHLSLHDK